MLKVGFDAQPPPIQKPDPPLIKQNVHRFGADVTAAGSYLYTAERRSARAANARLSSSISDIYDFRGKSVLDIGCGDGAYTVEFPALGVRRIVGIDPAAAAVAAANLRAASQGVSDTASFEVGNIYNLGKHLIAQDIDCIVLRGVLHHLPDPARAIAGLADFNGAILIVEPNGANPILKLIEKYSRYHVEHEERSFAPSLIRRWLHRTGFRVEESQLVNLVPFFCPDWAVAPLQWAEWPVERLPLVRDIACGQSVMLATKAPAHHPARNSS